MLISVPLLAVRIALFFVGFVVDLQKSQWDQKFLSGLSFMEKSVLQLPFFLMSLMRFVSPAMDEMLVSGAIGV
jgi:hypothetical protein